MTNEKLIEEAAKAIREADNDFDFNAGQKDLSICDCHRDGSEMVTCPRHTRPQGEPSGAQVAEIEQRVYDQHRGQIAGMAKALVRAGWDAALRTAGEVQ